MARNLILVGLMGTGKTTVGRALGAKLGWEQMDSDQWVEEKTGSPIPTIFKDKGESYFRDLEAEALQEICERENQIVTTGGGAPIREQNRRLMKEKGMVVALTADYETILKRVRGDENRPLLQGNLEERVAHLMEQRKGLYDFADLIVDTTGKDVEKIVEEILDGVRHQ
ncbi:shikimate kinase [Ammoniphilus sp. CFH 90114]|uniref:shikimate kinase n=1 Tax=Ammoniphilus sp. CFH 90114 TaxID=2493665 RepID=UPI00100F7883|nr:shikimate kinase [Ammoniphilus sp. CFH 90114]RXT13644.1 shikimate kinase [Ammoniphilus sp. CFH 90114]